MSSARRKRRGLMKSNMQPDEGESRSFSSIVQELVSGLQNLVRSEIHLTRAELKTSLKQTGKDIAMTLTFGIIAILGLLPFIAFLVIGLGRILDNRYWLSSLIVSLVCIGIGAGVGYYFARRLREQDLTLPHTRESVQNEVEIVKNKLQEVKETTQRRAS